MSGFTNREGIALVEAMIATIQQNAVLLSDIDGAIGDGDHGINMNKGFTLTAERLRGADADLTQGLRVLSDVLLGEIGGAMGPLYGSFFLKMAEATEGRDIDAVVFSTMLTRARDAVVELGGAQVGDKSLLDTLAPAIEAFDLAVVQRAPFADALDALAAAAETGKESTRNLVAKIGRASRLGERSRGVLDAGAVSCCLLLQALAHSSQTLLRRQHVL